MDLTKLADYAMLHMSQIIYAAVITLIGLLMASWLRRYLRHRLQSNASDPTLKLFLVNASYGLVVVLVLITALAQLGVPTASLITVLGASSIAIGLALKDSLSNVAAGLIIMFTKPFRVGDFIVVGGVSGTVQEINLFTTRLNTANNEVVYIPNANLLNGTIVNNTGNNKRRADLLVGISYDSNIGDARRVIQTVIDADKRIHKDPAPLIAVAELADSAVVLTVRCWINTSEYVATRFDLLEQIKLGLDSNGITIPFPQMDVHLNQV